MTPTRTPTAAERRILAKMAEGRPLLVGYAGILTEQLACVVPGDEEHETAESCWMFVLDGLISSGWVRAVGALSDRVLFEITEAGEAVVAVGDKEEG